MLKYVAVFLLVCFTQRALAADKVKVNVYYESLCPDSIKFFTKQLYPSLQKNISQYIDLTLVPYGKSTQTFNTVLNQWEFSCHHGPDECFGNKVQACAIAHIPTTDSDINMGYNKVTVAFINCLMDQVKRDPFTLPIRDCATLNKVPNVVDIENCANHTDGISLLSNLGHITEKLTPKLASVPTIVFNNMYKPEDNNLAQTNFMRALCGYITGEKPMDCQRTESAASSISSTLLPIFIAISSLLLFRM